MDFHRRSRRQTANILIKIHPVIALYRIKLLIDACPVAEQPELLLRRCLLIGIQMIWQVKGYAAEEDRDEGLGIDLHTAWVKLKIDAAGIPKAGIAAYLGMVRRLDENPNTDFFRLSVKIIGDHLSHPDAPVVNR